MNMNLSDWKLKLRYGKLTTDFTHYTIIADGKVVKNNADYNTSLGPAFMAMKVWAKDIDNANDVIVAVGKHLGFNVAGKLEVFKTDPQQAPKDHPYGYDINFTPYDN
jgi:hypothetical protein